MADQFEEINSTAGGSDVPRLPHNGLYLNPNQSRERDPNPYEDELAAAIEAAYANNVHDLDELIDRLNLDGPRDPDGKSWTTDSFTKTVHELAI